MNEIMETLGVLLAGVFVIAIVCEFIFSPDGYEDETGFHYGRPTDDT